MIRVAGLDLSLTSAGIARCTVDGDRISTHAQAIATDPSGKGIDGRRLRLNWLAGKLADAVGEPHLVLIEAPTYARNVTGSAHDRAGLWWLTIDRIMRAAPAPMRTRCAIAIACWPHRKLTPTSMPPLPRPSRIAAVIRDRKSVV